MSDVACNVLMVMSEANISKAESAMQQTRSPWEWHIVSDGASLLALLAENQTDDDTCPFGSLGLIVLDWAVLSPEQSDTIGVLRHRSLTSHLPLVIFVNPGMSRDAILKIYAQGAASVIPLPDKQDEFDQVLQAMVEYWSSVVRLPIETN